MADFIYEIIKVCATFFFLLFLLNQFSLNLKKRLPPGPPKFPIIGNMNTLFGGAPHRSLRDLSLKYGPLMHLKLGSISTVVISSPELAMEVMKTQDLSFATRPKVLSAKTLGYNYTDIALAPYGTCWRMLRKICTHEILSMKRVHSYRSVREEEAVSLVESIASSCGNAMNVNVGQLVFTYNHDITTRITIGKKSDDPLRFNDALREGIVLAGGFHIGDFFPSLQFVSSISGMKARVEKNFVELDSILSDLVEEHLQKENNVENEDLLDVLLRIKKNDELEMPLTIDNIKAVILDMFVAGTENAANTTEWAMTELMRNPEIMEKAQAEVRRVVGQKMKVEESDLGELAYMKLIIKETLRLHTPLALLLPRESMEACTINGYEIPAKTRTIINYWAIAMDPLTWKDPEVFQPERFLGNPIDFKGNDFEFIPFGAGRRICPGISFGVYNGELALASLLYHFDWKLPNGMKGEDLDMDETFGLTLSKTNNLQLLPSLHLQGS